MTKTDFLKNIKDIVTDKIYLTENLDELDKEIENNNWSIGIDIDTAKNVKNKDLKVFLSDVIKNRIVQLENSDKNMDLIFYSWFDEQAGNLNLSFINACHEKLPFNAEIEFVDSIDAIISDFLGSGYLDGIPWDELEETSGYSDENNENGFKLKVFKEKIIKSTKTNTRYR